VGAEDQQGGRPILRSAPVACCALHPAVDATATCVRCGDYACSACLSKDSSGLCVACDARRRQQPEPVNTRFVRVFLSLEGRISRSTYWLGTIGIYTVVLMGGIIAAAFGASTSEGENRTIALLLIGLVTGWPLFALQVKRWHDRDKSGWWIFISSVPVVGGFWCFIECYLLPGTSGTNHYGEDPVRAAEWRERQRSA
jgi:uncharacterized membrane protein YhaH (DUF805 family)